MRRPVSVEERFPIEVGADITGIIVVRHVHTGHVEHVHITHTQQPPSRIFETGQHPVSRLWTIYTLRRGWTVDRWDLEQWVSA